LDDGYFTLQIEDVRVFRSITVTDVLTSISGRYKAAFTTTTTTSHPSTTTIPTTTSTTVFIGTLFDGYVRVHAGTGKQRGTGDTAWIPSVAVLLSTGEHGHRL